MFSGRLAFPLLITLLLCLFGLTLQLEPTAQQATPQTISQISNKNARLLQTVAPVTPQASSPKNLLQIISEANRVRVERKIKPLSVDTSLNTIVSQWAKNIRGAFSLVTYIQIFGYRGLTIVDFETIPNDFLNDVIVKKAGNFLYSQKYTQVSYHSEPIGSDSQRPILVFKGASDQSQVQVTQKQTTQAITQIKEEREKVQQAQRQRQKALRDQQDSKLTFKEQQERLQALKAEQEKQLQTIRQEQKNQQNLKAQQEKQLQALRQEQSRQQALRAEQQRAFKAEQEKLQATRLQQQRQQQSLRDQQRRIQNLRIQQQKQQLNIKNEQQRLQALRLQQEKRQKQLSAQQKRQQEDLKALQRQQQALRAEQQKQQQALRAQQQKLQQNINSEQQKIRVLKAEQQKQQQSLKAEQQRLQKLRLEQEKREKDLIAQQKKQQQDLKAQQQRQQQALKAEQLRQQQALRTQQEKLQQNINSEQQRIRTLKAQQQRQQQILKAEQEKQQKALKAQQEKQQQALKAQQDRLQTLRSQQQQKQQALKEQQEKQQQNLKTEQDRLQVLRVQQQIQQQSFRQQQERQQQALKVEQEKLQALRVQQERQRELLTTERQRLQASRAEQDRQTSTERARVDSRLIPQALSAPRAPTLPLIAQTQFENTTSFTNLILTHSVPSTFVKNQYFTFKGHITIPNPSGLKVTVIFTRVNDLRKSTFTQNLPANQKNFQILTYLTLTGSFYISVFPGLSGITTTEKYRVVPQFFGKIVSRTPAPIKKAALNWKDNELTLNWQSSQEIQPGLTSIIISQDQKTSVTLLLSNYQKKLVIPYQLFSSFTQGSTKIQISQAFSLDESAASQTSEFSPPNFILFNATQHYQALVRQEAGIDPIPLRLNTNDSVSISGRIRKDLKNEVILLTPHKKFQSYYLDQSKRDDPNAKVSAGTSVNLKIPIRSSGTYILQVNDDKGIAVVNVPIYVGQIYPLLPDYSDLQPQNSDTEALNRPTFLADRRIIVLNLINKARNQFGVQEVYQDQQLGQLAQEYSSLQIQQRFIGHIDNKGLGPEERAKAAGIFDPVGQSVAVNKNLTAAHLSLQRSPSNLRNIVDAKWTRAGLGIVQNRNGDYHLTQVFSSRDLKVDPLKQRQLSLISQQIIKLIRDESPQIRNENVDLSRQLEIYEKLRTKPPIVAYLQQRGYRSSDARRTRVSYNSGDFIKLINKDAIKPVSASSREVGVAVSYQQGLLQILTAYL